MARAAQKVVDYIIVGMGLAGGCLAVQLLQRGQRVLVFDEPAKNRASSIAAGLFNPVTGKVMSKSHRAEWLFPFLHKFYRETEVWLKDSFFHPTPMYRPFTSIGEQNEWMAKSADPDLEPFIREVISVSTFGNFVKDPIGGLLLSQCGYLEVSRFLTRLRENLMEKDAFRDAPFELNHLDASMEVVEYEGIRARKIIFCQGIHSNQNPLFQWLNLRPLKGEVLEVTAELPQDTIFNRGVYVVPREKARYRVGATYESHDLQPGTTEKGKQELETKLSELLSRPYQVVHQEWGIRPTVADRKPILGAHPEYKNVVIFNGLGTKGVSLAPYYSARLVKWLLEGVELDPETNIARFKSLYSKF